MTDTSIGARGIAGGDIRIGHIFGRAWEIFTANFLKFFIITMIVALPNTLLVGSISDPQTAPDGGLAARVLIGAIIAIVLGMLTQAVILYMAFQYLRGQSASIGDAVQKALPRLLPLLGLIFLASLGWTIGLMLLVIPGIILMVRWSVSIPVCVVERLGPVASLKRSAELTKGHRWKIFGMFFLIWLISMVIGIVIGAVMGALGHVFVLVANLLWTAAWAGYFNSVWAMIYHDLRVAKDGVDVEQIASVFD